MTTKYKNLKLLLADDDEPFRCLLKIHLERLGFNTNNIYCAKNGEEAYKVFLDECPDVILMDTEMPGPKGYEICKKIRDQQGQNNVKIIGMSSNQSFGSYWKNSGANYFASKDQLVSTNVQGLGLGELIELSLESKLP